MSDFNPDSSNKFQDTRGFPKSGLSAGVESGLSSVEAIKRGSIESEQMTKGTTFRKNEVEAAAGSKNGKSFTFKS